MSLGGDHAATDVSQERHDLVPVIDTHHHLWDSRLDNPPWLHAPPPAAAFQGDMTPIWKSYLIDDYLRDIAGNGVSGSVYVECGWAAGQAAAEARWVQSVADQHGYPHAIVAHADLADPGLPEHLEALAAIPKVRGIRQTLNWDSDPRYSVAARADLMQDPQWLRGLRRLGTHGLHFELSVYPAQMADAARALRGQDTAIVLSHAGMPLRKDDDTLRLWRSGLRALATNEQVIIKLSGLGMFDHAWTADSIRPFILEALDIYGPRRCVFGSNFPVDRLYSGYRRLLEAIRLIIAGLSPAEQRQVLHDTAARAYRLAPATVRPAAGPG
jgi:predicted TIM-barrel fold metal-dependent hydrolase